MVEAFLDVGNVRYEQVNVVDAAGNPVAGGQTVKFAKIDANAINNDVIVALVALKKIRVLSYVFVSSATGTAYFRSNPAGSALSGAMALIANAGVSSGYSPVGHFETAAGESLTIQCSADIDLAGHLSYVEI